MKPEMKFKLNLQEMQQTFVGDGHRFIPILLKIFILMEIVSSAKKERSDS